MQYFPNMLKEQSIHLWLLFLAYFSLDLFMYL